MKEYIRLADCLELLRGTSVCMWYITDWSETTNTERRRWQSAEQLRLGRPGSACIISPSYDRGARNAICSQRPRACTYGETEVKQARRNGARTNGARLSDAMTHYGHNRARSAMLVV